MFAIMFLMFLLVPIVEFYLLMLVSQYIGFSGTLLLIVFTAIVGTKFVKQQGLSTLENIQKSTAEGKVPTEALIDGVFILISGLLLLTPGILTDCVGFSLLVPFVRRAIGSMAKNYFKNRVTGSFKMTNANGSAFFMSTGPMSGPMSGPTSPFVNVQDFMAQQNQQQFQDGVRTDRDGNIVIEAKNVRVHENSDDEPDSSPPTNQIQAPKSED